MEQPVDVASLIERLRARVGTEAAAYSRLVEPGALVKFARATGQTEAVYLDPARGPVAAPTYISTFCADGLAGLFQLDLPLPVFVHSDDVAELGEPIRGGDTITTSGQLVDVFVKNGRRGPVVYQTARLRLQNQHGQHVATLDVSSANFQ